MAHVGAGPRACPNGEGATTGGCPYENQARTGFSPYPPQFLLAGPYDELHYPLSKFDLPFKPGHLTAEILEAYTLQPKPFPKYGWHEELRQIKNFASY